MSGTAPNYRTVVLQDESLRGLQGFTQVPNVVLKHQAISFGAKVAFGVLLSYAWQDDFCFPAQDRLARDLNCSVRQVQRLLKELKDAAFIDWRQQGLNRPNVYYILSMSRWNAGSKSVKNKDTTLLSYPATTEVSGPDATHPSLQEATDLSPKEDSRKKIQMNVNVTLETPARTDGGKRCPRTISEAALANSYGLTDGQIDATCRLVDLQIEVLGAGDRNHAAYVKRAAEAVRDDTAKLLQLTLADVKDASHRKAIASLPAYFTRVYDAMRGAASRPQLELLASQRHQLTGDSSPADFRKLLRQRLLTSIAASDHPIPSQLRDASTADIALRDDQAEPAAPSPRP